MKSPLSLADLMIQFAFDPDDLVANRHGTLSAAQVARLSKRCDRVRWVFLFIDALFVVIGVIIVAGGLSAGDMGLVIGGIVVCGALLILMLFFACRMARALQRDLAQGIAAAITGPGRAFAVYVVRGSLYYLAVGDQRFEITIRQYMALKDVAGAIYTAYYAPESRRLLTLEPGESV
ncbi:MAG: hypothetical protein JXA10_16070 [Anaerolineae bacterium]|nr:hypothetical protein [Anaerolineae bacterium]